MLSVLFKYLMISHTQHFPSHLEALRFNYELISQVISDTTLGVESPLFSMWNDIKKGVHNLYTGGSVVKKVIGNLEYQ